MNYSVDKKEKYSLITLEADKLTALISPELKSEFVVLNGDNVSNIVLDLSKVLYCDSSGLSAILIGNRLCKEAGGSFVLAGLNSSVEKLITISQLETVLTIVPTVNEAIDTIILDTVSKEVEEGE
ncbi:MAG: STAS domain-containing protein [Flavobacteriales bacterium]|nr:STAS domain-containing protein [Flavobacteriales bacterium]